MASAAANSGNGSLAARLCALAGTHAEEPALLVPGREALSFGRLARQSASSAQTLRGRGIPQGAVVASLLADGPETMEAALTLLPHAALAPLDPASAPDEIAAALADLRPAAVLAGDAWRDRDPLRDLGIPVLGFPLPPPNSFVPDFDLPAADMPALVLRTSATTGAAKPVVISHGNLDAMSDSAGAAMGIRSSDRFLSLMPSFHLQALLSVLHTASCGGVVICPGPYDPEKFIVWLRDYAPTWYSGGPTLHRATLPLLRAAGRRNWPDLRFVRSIGAALPPELAAELEEVLGVPVIEGYGLSEAGAVTSNPFPPRARKPGSAGLCVGPPVRIVDDAGNDVAPGSAGEILVGGPSVVRDSLVNGWLHTGDLGRFDEDGYLYIVGRVKEMINRGGEKIAPAEIDAALSTHPAVSDCAAFAVPHPRLGEDVAAAVVLRPDTVPPGEGELRRFLSERVAPYRVPRRILFVDAIPRGATGKPQRHRLAAELAPAVAARPPAREFASAPEQIVAEIWSRILEAGPVHPDDDFFALGGDSLAAAVMLAEAEERLGAVPDISAFLLRPTVAELARSFSSAGGQPRRLSALVPLQPHGDGAPFFCMPDAHGDPYHLAALSLGFRGERPFLVLRDPRPLAERGVPSLEETACIFCEAVKARQPAGPYLLGGHCFGGIVAFEMARQLAAAGNTVALVVMLDTPRPGYPKPLNHWQSYLRYAGAALRSRTLPWAAVAAHVRYVAGLKWRRVQAQVAPPLGASLPAGATATPLNQAAARRYAPGPYAGRVVQLIAAGEAHTAEVLADSRLAWRELVSGGWEVVRIGGKHGSMVDEQHAAALAAVLRPLLRQALARH